MARLPRLRSDHEDWGTILNDFLMQVHEANGLLRPGVVGTESLKDGVVTSSKISAGTVAILNDRATHTGTQSIETVDTLQASLDVKVSVDTLVYNVKDHGAVGDGVADDTNAINATAVMAAGAVLYFPNGVFKTTATIVIASGTRVEFAGRKATLKYKGSTDALKASNSKGISIHGGGTIDISGAGLNAAAIHFAGVWFSRIADMKIIQGPKNSTGIFIETSAAGGDHYGSYCIDIDNLDATIGAGAAAIKTQQTQGDGPGVWRNTHIRINNGWSKGKMNGLYLEQTSSIEISGFVADTGVNGYLIKDSDNMIIRPGEIGPVTDWAITFAGSNESVVVYAPSYAGASGVLGYLDTSSYKPTVFDRSSVVLKGSAQVNEYYTTIESRYNYDKSFSVRARGGGVEQELLSWGDSTGLNIEAGLGGVNVNDDMNITNGRQLRVKALDSVEQVLMYHEGTYGQIESTTGLVLVSNGSHSTTISGAFTPQLRVQHSGGSYGYVSIENDDVNGKISTNVGDLILTSEFGQLNADNKRLINLSNPLAPQDVATKSYVDNSGWTSAPLTSTSQGVAGQKAYDAAYYYVCVAANTWKRHPLVSW